MKKKIVRYLDRKTPDLPAPTPVAPTPVARPGLSDHSVRRGGWQCVGTPDQFQEVENSALRRKKEGGGGGGEEGGGGVG